VSYVYLCCGVLCYETLGVYVPDTSSALLSLFWVRILVFFYYHYASTPAAHCTSTNIATNSTRDAYAVVLMLSPSACILCVLLLSLYLSVHQHPLWMWRSGS